MKKILLMCNQGNNFFSLVRYLRDKGYDAHLMLMKEEFDHFNPRADSYNENYKKYVRKSFFSMLPTGFYLIPKDQIKNAVQDFEFIIGCGLAPAYLNKVGLKLDIFIPYGSDLDYQPYFRRKNYFNKKILKIIYVTYHQKMGIKKSRFVMKTNANSTLHWQYKNLNHHGDLIIGTVPLIYDRQYKHSILKKYLDSSSNDFIESMKKIRESTDFIVFHHCRHLWSNRSPIDYKGNEKLLKGFKKFTQNKKEIKSCLILFEYGEDVDKSKKLIKDLDIESNVKWFQITYRKDIMIGINLCDVGVAALADLSWITYSVVCEFMCMSKPIIMYREDELYKKNYEYLYPIINASDDDSVASALMKICQDKELSLEMGKESKKWFSKYVAGDGLRKIINAIES